MPVSLRVDNTGDALFASIEAPRFVDTHVGAPILVFGNLFQVRPQLFPTTVPTFTGFFRRRRTDEDVFFVHVDHLNAKDDAWQIQTPVGFQSPSQGKKQFR